MWFDSSLWGRWWSEAGQAVELAVEWGGAGGEVGRGWRRSGLNSFPRIHQLAHLAS